METKKITVKDALTKIYAAICMLTVQGPDNARILVTVCDDLKTIVQALEEGGKKQDDTNTNASGND